jgi:hypothetical protein
MIPTRELFMKEQIGAESRLDVSLDERQVSVLTKSLTQKFVARVRCA